MFSRAKFLGWAFTILLGVVSNEAFSREIARVTLSPGWATFGMAVPQGMATNALQVGNLQTQTDVKNRWPDKTVKFAVLTCKPGTAGQYAVTAASSAATGSIAPQVPTAAVKFTIDGKEYTATVPSAPTSDNWLSGALVREWRSAVTPVNASGAAHNMLLVLFDVRSYNDGTSRLDVTVENDYDLSTGATLRYGVDIVANGQTVFHRDRVEHWLFCRWRKVFSLGASLSEVTDDFEPAFQAKALPLLAEDREHCEDGQGTEGRHFAGGLGGPVHARLRRPRRNGPIPGLDDLLCGEQEPGPETLCAGGGRFVRLVADSPSGAARTGVTRRTKVYGNRRLEDDLD